MATLKDTAKPTLTIDDIAERYQDMLLRVAIPIQQKQSEDREEFRLRWKNELASKIGFSRFCGKALRDLQDGRAVLSRSVEGVWKY